jgi:NADPH:quinone reductase-like Zn-dependent oxidoreductase
MKAYEIHSDRQGIDALTLVERPEPTLQAGQVLVKMHAASLNFRDIQVLRGTYGVQPSIPLSDGAGEVVAVAEGVTRWQSGDRVAGIFRQSHISGELTLEKNNSGLGGEIDGVLAEFVVFDQQGLVSVPAHLSYEEAATLPCAAVTAWNALVVEGQLKAGDTVLLLGTGGVSIFALQFAKQMGAKVIITSSSDEKLQQAKTLGADIGINYQTTPNWDEKVNEITEGRGVDTVLELGGSATLSKSLNAVRFSGTVMIIGVINGIKGEINIASILGKHVRVQGISVGSGDSFEDMNRAIDLQQMHPIIDRVFPFDKAKEALAYLESGAHFGKVVITI